MHAALKTKIKLNNQQKTKMAQHAGYARWVWNWALNLWNQAEVEGLKPTAAKLKKFYTNHVKPQYPWMNTLSSRVYQFVFMHLGEAFSRFFQGRASHPKFKKKGRNDSFTLDNCGKVMEFSGIRLKLPFLGWVSTYEPLPEIQTKRVTISRVADSWYLSVAYEFEPESTVKSRDDLGVDVGVKVLATCSDGTVFENPRAYKKAQKKLARLQRELNRRQLGSANRNKTKLKLAKAHQRIANIRKDAIHKLTSWLCKNHAVIGLAESWRCRFPSRQTFQEEDLNVSGMMKKRCDPGRVSRPSAKSVGRVSKGLWAEPASALYKPRRLEAQTCDLAVSVESKVCKRGTSQESGATPRHLRAQAQTRDLAVSVESEVCKRGKAHQERERAPRHHKLAGTIADSALYEIRRQAEYKAEWYGSVLVFADRFYPSSKTCSSCGQIQEMPLKERVFHCEACGSVKDRDLNASLNLKHYAEGYSVGACGIGSADTL